VVDEEDEAEADLGDVDAAVAAVAVDDLRLNRT